MKNLFILIVLASIFSCETSEEKKERIFLESVLSSNYLKSNSENYFTKIITISSVKKGYLSKKKFISDFNLELGSIIGYSNNLDTIENRLKRKTSLYYKYLVNETSYLKSSDSLKTIKYKKAKDSILILLQNN